MPFLILMLGLAFVLAGCGPAEERAERDAGGILVPPGTAAEYERRILFLTTDGDSPMAAVFDFRVLTGGPMLRRSARGLLAGEEGWTLFLEAEWATEPMRDPWRIVPHGPLRLVIGEADELEALVHRGSDRPVRLEPGTELGTWSPGPGSQFRLQRARLRNATVEAIGVLLDIQLGRRLPDRDGPRVEGESSAGATSAAEAVEVFLTDGVELFVVLTATADRGPAGWALRGPDEMAWDAVEIGMLESAPIGNGGSAGAMEVPMVWSVRADRGGLMAELRSEAAGPPAGDGAGAGRGRLHLVEGWVELGGERRFVFGLIGT